MGVYIMSDIHGCYDDFLSMLEKINFSDTDQLIMAGDSIDRGKQSYEREKLKTDFTSNEDTAALYDSVKYFVRRGALSALYFDVYGTIRFLLEQNQTTMHDLCRWSAIIRQIKTMKGLLGSGCFQGLFFV